MFKRLLNHTIVQHMLAYVLSLYIRLANRTTRWDIEGIDILKPIQDSRRGFIACSWHSRFMMSPAGWSKMSQTPHVLISKSRDGNLVAYTAKFLNVGVVRGSRKAKFKDKNKRGAGALREMVSIINNGDCIYMTPDGPKGPRMRMGEGAIRLAKLTGAPLLAYALSTSRHKLFNSWDRFMLPKPFARGKVIIAGPIHVPSDASEDEIERLRLDFEDMLNTASQRCDSEMGITPIVPEPELVQKS